MRHTLVRACIGGQVCKLTGMWIDAAGRHRGGFRAVVAARAKFDAQRARLDQAPLNTPAVYQNAEQPMYGVAEGAPMTTSERKKAVSLIAGGKQVNP